MRSDLLRGERLRGRRRFAAPLALGVLALAWIAAVRGIPGQSAFLPAKEPPPVSSAPRAISAQAPLAPTRTTETATMAPVSTLKTRPLSAWLADIASEAGCDLVVSPELRGDLTASEVSKLGWEERLQAYSRVFGFEVAVHDGLIEVTRATAPPRSVTSRDSREKDAAAAGAQATAAAAAADAGGHDGAKEAASADHRDVAAPGPPPQTRVVRLAYAAAKDVATVLAQAGKALDVTITADASTNSMVASGQPSAITRVLGVLGELDRPRRRVLLDAKIVEVTRSARTDLGVEWKLTGNAVGGDVKFPPNVSDAGSAALVIATHGASALDARISALEAGGKLHVVSRPSVVMLEGSPATIESARILRIRLPSRGSVVGDEVVEAPSNGRATEEIPVGVRLEVTPAIRGGGRVLLRIKAKSSSLGAPLPPDDIPEELSRMVDAEVLVSSGETAVLGGLTRESGTQSGSGVPVLHRVPGVGLLFGKKADAKEEEELLVLVTPRVLD